MINADVMVIIEDRNSDVMSMSKLCIIRSIREQLDISLTNSLLKTQGLVLSNHI